MLRRLIEFSLTQRLLTLCVYALVAGAGAYAFWTIPIDAFPNISPVQVKMILKAPGMTPEEVETRVITPIEMELLGIPGQTVLRSAAKYAVADITLDFEEGTDIYWARQQVAERLSQVRADLPASVTGGLAPVSTPLSDVFMFTIEGGDLSLEQRRSLLDWTIRPALRTIPGVADVNALGGLVRTFEVVPNSAALAAAGLGVSDLASAIEASNRNDGAGRLSEGEKALVVRAEGAIRSLDDLEQIVLKAEGARVLRLADVAAVQIGSLTRYGAVTKDGNGEAVQGLVLSLRGADASAIVKAVRQRLEEIKPSLPAGVHIDVFYDRSDLITSAVGTVTKALMEATILVVILLVAFLGNLRAAIVVAVTLPFAALVTFVMMKLFGMSANLMSLGGPGDRDRSHRRCGGRRGRKHRRAPPAYPRHFRSQAARHLSSRLQRSHAGGCGHSHHLPRVSAAAVPAGPRRQVVCTCGPDDHFRAERLIAAFTHADPGPGLIHAEARASFRTSLDACADRRLSAAAQGLSRLSAPGLWAGRARYRLGRHRVRCHRQNLHADHG